MTMQQIIMYGIGIVLIILAIKKRYEPELLLPLGFGTILVNLPVSGVVNQNIAGIGEVQGILEWLYRVGIEASEAFPILLFIGIGAMIDFTPLLSRPIYFVFGLAAQFGIFVAIGIALLLGFELKDAFSVGIYGVGSNDTTCDNKMHYNKKRTSHKNELRTKRSVSENENYVSDYCNNSSGSYCADVIGSHWFFNVWKSHSRKWCIG